MIINGNTYNNSSYRMDLIWENEDPTVQFPSTTNLQINVSKYKWIYITFRGSVLSAGSGLHTQIFTPLSDNTRLMLNASTTRYYRKVYVENSYLMFGSCYARDLSTPGSTTSVDDRLVIPYRIYGVY